MSGSDSFTCSICAEPSTSICNYCTLDACGNHLCERCRRCSDCCTCDVHLRSAESAPISLNMPAYPRPTDQLSPDALKPRLREDINGLAGLLIEN